MRPCLVIASTSVEVSTRHASARRGPLSSVSPVVTAGPALHRVAATASKPQSRQHVKDASNDICTLSMHRAQLATDVSCIPARPCAGWSRLTAFEDVWGRPDVNVQVRLSIRAYKIADSLIYRSSAPLAKELGRVERDEAGGEEVGG